jgi:hypothetical protein
LVESLEYIFKVNKEKGPFDVILGHSQGAAMLFTICAAYSSPDELEAIAISGLEERIHINLIFSHLK